MGAKYRKSHQKSARSEDLSKKALLEDSVSSVDYVLVFETKAKDPQAALKATLEQLRDAGYTTAVQKGLKSSVLITVGITEEKLGAGSTVKDDGQQNSVVSEKAAPLIRRGLVFEALNYDGVFSNKYPHITGGFIPSSQSVNKSIWERLNLELFISPDILREQYGEQVGILFAFFNHTIRCLIPSVLIGAMAQLLLGPYSVFIGAVQLIWGIWFCFSWRTQEKRFAAKWNAPLVVSGVDNPAYNTGNKFIAALRSFAYIPLAIWLCSLYLAGSLGILGLEVFFTQIYNGPYQKLLKLVPAGANAAWGVVFGIMYQIFLAKYMSWEVYPSVQAAETVRIRRQFYANFVINYAPLFLTAYLYLPFGHFLANNYQVVQFVFTLKGIPTQASFELQTSRLSTQAIYFAITNQFVGIFTDSVLPIAVQAVKSLIKADKEPGKSLRLDQARAPFDVNTDILAITSIFGYSLVAGPALPIFSLAALVGVILRSRASLFRLCGETSRPVPSRKASIGAWNSHLLFLTGVASVTTPTLCVMYGMGDFASGPDGIVSASILTLLIVAFVSENLFMAMSKLAEHYVQLLPANSQQKGTGLVVRSLKSEKACSDKEIESQVQILSQSAAKQ